MRIVIASLYLALFLTACAGTSQLAGRLETLGLSMRDEIGLEIEEEREMAVMGNITVLHAKKDNTAARIRVRHDIPREAAEQYIDEQTTLLRSLFDPKLPPYPEFLTKETGCAQSFMPRERQNRLGPYHILYAGDRFGYGICTDDLASYRAAVGWFYCGRTKRLFSVEYFIARGAEDETRLHALFESLVCI